MASAAASTGTVRINRSAFVADYLGFIAVHTHNKAAPALDFLGKLVRDYWIAVIVTQHILIISESKVGDAATPSSGL
jgi:hypothetical protein